MGENIFEKPCSVFDPSVSFCSASAKNFHFGASLKIINLAYLLCSSTRILEMLGCVLNLNKIKLKYFQIT